MLILKQWWKAQPSEKQVKFKKWGSGALFVFFVLIYYYGFGNKAPIENKSTIKSEVTVEKNLLEDDITANVNNVVNRVNDQMDKQNERVDALYDMMEALVKRNEDLNQSSNQDIINTNNYDSINNGYKNLEPLTSYPEPPTYTSNSETRFEQIKISEPKIIGAIGRTEGSPFKKEEKVKKKRIFHLPPSFMEGKLLVGLDSMTTELGKGNPKPVFFRVQAPAILPNSLKANLKGCFVIGNATGNLASERVEVRLISLHCKSLTGHNVIDVRIKGVVADQDGKQDLAGNVISRAGANLARSIMAGVAGGVGDAISLSSVTNTISPLGSIQTVDPSKIMQSGLGQGMKSGLKEIQTFYLDYAKQATPIIEIGGAKPVTIIIQESVDIEIKDYENEEDN